MSGLTIVPQEIMSSAQKYYSARNILHGKKHLDTSRISVSFQKGSLERYFITNPSVNPSILISATIVLIIAGAIAGFLPAKKASKIKPIVALRNG